MTTTTKTPYVQQPRIHNQNELDQLIKEGLEAYKNGLWVTTATGSGTYTHPCANKQFFPSATLAFEYAKEQFALGCELYPNLPPSVQGAGVMLTFYKPESELTPLLEAEAARITAVYEESINSHNQAQITLLTTQLYEAAKKKEQKVIDDKETKARSAASEEATKYFTNLIKESK